MKRNPPAGPDPRFPRLSERERLIFPEPEGSSLVAVGGNLSPGMLLSAYEQGVFPWYSEEDPLLWHSPDPRFVVFPDALHVSASMRKVLKQGRFELSLDRDFPAVIRGCAAAERPGQDGTWITPDMIAAYCELHRLGWAHCAEARRDGMLVGGCYGIRLGGAFFGESMFALAPDASKAAFLSLARLLFSDGVRFVDCQVPTDHLRSLGGREIARADFLRELAGALAGREAASGKAGAAAAADELDRRGNWGDLYPGFPSS